MPTLTSNLYNSENVVAPGQKEDLTDQNVSKEKKAKKVGEVKEFFNPEIDARKKIDFSVKVLNLSPKNYELELVNMLKDGYDIMGFCVSPSGNYVYTMVKATL